MPEHVGGELGARAEGDAGLAGMRRWIRLRYVFLVAFIVAAVVVVFRQGVLPARFTPLPAINLSDPNNWLYGLAPG